MQENYYLPNIPSDITSVAHNQLIPFPITFQNKPLTPILIG